MKTARDMTVREIMMSSPVTLKADDVLSVADDIMNLGRIRHIPIVEGDRVVGVVSQRDLFRSALVTAMELKPRQQKELLRSIRISEVMRTPVISVSPEAGVADAASMMIAKKIGCLPVVEDGALVGLLTETDLLRLVAERAPGKP